MSIMVCLSNYLASRNHCRGKAVFFICVILLLLSIIFYPISPGSAVSIQTAATAGGGGEAKLHVFLDDELLDLETKLYLEGEGIMLPLRTIVEKAGFAVSWNNRFKMVTLQGQGREIILYPGNPLYAVNGILYRTGQHPLLKDGRVLVGLDILEKSAGIVLWAGTLEKGILQFKVSQETFLKDNGGLLISDDPKDFPTYFIEILLPPEGRVESGAWFDIRLAAGFARDIYAYEVSFFYDPSIIQIINVHNPAYLAYREFHMKEIDNKEGTMRYTLTTLGAQDILPPRDILAVIEAVVFREVDVPLGEGTMQVTLLDNRARSMPVGLEERVLYVGPAAE